MSYVSTRTEVRAQFIATMHFPPDADPELRAAAKYAIEAYRRGALPEGVVHGVGILISRLGGLYRVLDRYNVVYLLPSAHFERVFVSKPQVVVQAGARGSGKTITAWTLALRWLRRHPRGEIHVIGDIDEMAPVLAEKGFPVVAHEEPYFPPGSRPEFIIFNELTEDVLSTSAVKRSARTITLQQFRARHYRAWFVFNAVRHRSLLSAVRETSEAVLMRFSPPQLAYALYEALPPGYKDLAFLTMDLDPNRAIAVYTVKGAGTFVAVYPTDPPKWLLDAQRVASRKRKLKPLGKNERNARIRELAAAGLTSTEIARVLREEGYGKISDARVRQIIRAMRERGELK